MYQFKAFKIRLDFALIKRVAAFQFNTIISKIGSGTTIIRIYFTYILRIELLAIQIQYQVNKMIAFFSHIMCVSMYAHIHSCANSCNNNMMLICIKILF